MFELAPFDLPGGYGEGIVPLADVKAWCSIEAGETEFDDLLSAMRDAAVDMVERYCGVFLAQRAGVTWRADALPKHLRLPVRPVTAVTAFRYLDSTDAAQNFAVAGLRIASGAELRLFSGVSWPAGSGFEITFTAGHTAANRPSALVTAVKMFAAHLFANREAVSTTGTVGGEIPLGFQVLCNQFRPVGI